VNCLEIPDSSDFWRRVYNMGGGPDMRCNAYDFISQTFKLNGLSGIEACTERRWYALRNFHMQYYEDSYVLNEYLHYWRDSLDSYWKLIAADMPLGMKMVAALCRGLPPVRRQVERLTYTMLKRSVEEHRNGTVYWYAHHNDWRISAFYKDNQTYETIPAWGIDMPQLVPEPEWQLLKHGYDESKATLDLADLYEAARFRGGDCLAIAWDGDMFANLEWCCARGHTFTAKPNTVLKAGHWCPQCVPPPWDYDEEASLNPFFAQVWYPNHDLTEHNIYPAECTRDIVDADKGE